MTIEFHPAVQTDFNQALDYYQAEGGSHLADRFEGEFRACLTAIEAGPSQFPYYLTSHLFRRIRLKNFPYLVVYRAIGNTVRVTLLRHERRRPRFGLTRWQPKTSRAHALH